VAKNYYFENFENSGEQNLVEDLVIESIKIYGMDVWYIPRTLVAKDDILNEDDLSTFDNAYMVEMYVKSVDGFEGEGDFLSKFGLQIRDSITMTIAQKTYDLEIGSREASVRPLEGDLIYLPLNNKIFEINHVEHENIFYQMGSLQSYDLRAELFEYSGERFNTGQKFIDDEFVNVDLFVPSADVTYTVTYSAGNFYLKDTSETFGATVKTPIIELEIGRKYIFDQSETTNTGNTLSIYDASDFNISNNEIPGILKTGTPGTDGKTTLSATTQGNTSGNYYYRTTNGTTFGTVVLVKSKLDNVETYDSLADNNTIDDFINNDTPSVASDNIIDFSQSNPFGEDTF